MSSRGKVKTGRTFTKNKNVKSNVTHGDKEVNRPLVKYGNPPAVPGLSLPLISPKSDTFNVGAAYKRALLGQKPYLQNKLPPKTLKMATVRVISRKSKRMPKEDDEDSHSSLPSARDCLEARPPLPLDLSGPTVFSYHPANDPPQMTSFPSYTFRPKTQSDRDGGDRTAWDKEWFAHNYVWLQKADFDPRVKWPSPAHYKVKAAVGYPQPVYTQSPCHTFGTRKEFNLIRRGASKEPAPNTYNHGDCKDQIMRRPLVFTIQQGRRKGTMLWSKRESVPGPGSYNPKGASMKPKSAAFSFSMTPRTFNLETRWTL